MGPIPGRRRGKPRPGTATVADMEEVLPLSAASFHILLVLADGHAHGYAIMQEVEQLTGGTVRLGPGTLYRSLQKLLVDGLIEELPMGMEAEDERRRYYRLTAQGLRIARAESERLRRLVTLARQRGLLRAGSGR